MSSSHPVWSGPNESTRQVSMDYFMPQKLQTELGKIKQFLGEFVTTERMERLEQAVQARSRRVLSVFEDTHPCYNIGAVLRSVDAFGFLDAFFIYTLERHKFRFKDSVERGASQWLNLRRASDVEMCGRLLKAAGYRIALVTRPDFEHTSSYYRESLPEFQVADFRGEAFQTLMGDSRIAVIFGSEKTGVSKEWLNFADLYIHVSMHGFVESLNVSVCAGIILHGLRSALVDTKSEQFRLSAHEQSLILDQWLVKTVARVGDLICAKRLDLVDYFKFLSPGGFFAPFQNLP